MKKWFRSALYLLIAVLFLFPTLLAGCGNTAPAASSSSASQQVRAKTATVSITNGGKTQSGKVSVHRNDTVYVLLKKYVQAKHVEMSATGSGKMVYVTSIDHRKAGKQSGWLFTVNGKQSKKGAGAVVVKSGDRIAWHYSHY
ncbi:MAG: DUF4430 domain-containing protein [Sporolactobacillus sp.]|jgi:biopolymer transport protein ExbD|nr:DUF4430 domain-containing protein [Sporolactobacillus sp.]